MITVITIKQWNMNMTLEKYLGVFDVVTKQIVLLLKLTASLIY